MKKNYVFFAAIAVAMFMGSAVKAQEATLQTSTAGAPIWYNLNSAATAAGAINAGLAQVTGTGNFEGVEIIKGTVPGTGIFTAPNQNQDKYLWRFEADGANVYIVNKATGLKILNPPTAKLALLERFRMNESGSTYIPTSVAGISGNGVSGTAFYFTPTDAAFAAVGRMNCDGGVAELVLFKATPPAMGDVAQTGGKGSLFWLRLVPMKSVTVSVSAASTAVGTVAIMKDDATTPEAANTVSKAQSIGVTVVATATTGQFVEWKNVSTGLPVATTASYTYSGTADIQLEAVFGNTTSMKQVSANAGVYPNPFNNSLQVENAIRGSKISIFDLAGKEVLSSVHSIFNTTKLEKGSYILKYNSEEGIKTMKVTKQ